MKRTFLALLCAIVSIVASAQFTSAPAFPGAEGHGRYVTGGRGGTIVHVTNLNDSGTGSFRAAVTGGSNRIIVFDVAGVIALQSDIRMKSDLTILGQTAPSPGITLRYYTVQPGANNIIRYIRFRRGQEKDLNDGADATWQREVTGLILDHCSFSWSIDEVASFYDNNNFTMQWCTVGEALNDAGHGKGAHGYGGIWGGKLASFHHNMLIHLNNRVPRFNGARYNWGGYTSNKNYSEYNWQNAVQAENVDFRNCVMYNWGDGNGCYGGPGGGQINIVNNYYKAGPSTKNTTRVTQISFGESGNMGDDKTFINMSSRYYINGNYVTKATTPANYDWQGVTYDVKTYTKNGEYYTPDAGNYYNAEHTTINSTSCVKIKMDAPAPIGSVTTHTAENAYTKVLDYAGASLYRDNVDERYAREIKNNNPEYTGSVSGKKGIIDVVADVNGYTEANFGTGSRPSGFDTDNDGIPDAWEDKYGLDKNSADDALTKTLDKKGYYTNLEVYANSLVEKTTKAERADAAETFEEYYPVLTEKSDPDAETTLFSLEVTSTNTLSLDYQKSSSLASYATIEGGSATVYNGKNNTTAQKMVANKAVNLGGSSASYLKIELADGKTFAAGDVITITDAGNWKVSTTSSNSGAITIATPYTIKNSDAFAGKSELYIFKTGTSGDPSSIKSITITHGSNGGDTPDDDDDVVEDPDPEPVAVKPVAKKGFDFIVGRDGDINAAIAEANAWTGSGRYLIFVPDGRHKMTGNADFTTKSDASGSTYKWDEDTKQITTGSISASTKYTDNAMTWLKKSNVSIIGQSMNGTEIYNIPYIPGISYTSTLEIRNGYSNTYLQDFTLKNLYAGGANDKGVAVAFYDRGTNTITKNLNAWSNQDTYTSAATRCYYETSTFAGTVDFICGSGDVWFEKCDLVINNRKGNVITAPSTKSTELWGYVFNGCTISKADGATLVTDGNWNLGRPWKEAPASTFINTKMNVLPSNSAWTNMTANLAIRFHEYGSTNSNGNLLDLSKRSVSACNGATADKPVLTEAKASKYKVSSVVGANNWDPRALALQVGVSNVTLTDNTLSWDNNDYALCWVVFKDGKYYDDVITNSITLTETGTYTVRAANSMGGLGEETEGKHYEATTTTNIVWDFSEYTTQVTLAGDNYSVEYKGLTLVGNTTSTYTNDYVKSTTGFHCNGQSSSTIRYISFTPTVDGIWKVTGKGNGSSKIRIIAIGTKVATFSTLASMPADGVLVAGETSDGKTAITTTIEAYLKAGTTYYAYFATGGSSITRLEFDSTIPPTISEANSYASFTEGTCDVKLKKVFPQGEWTSLVLPFSATTAQLMEAFPNSAANTEIAAVKEMKNNVVYFITQAHIDANVPVLIKVGDTREDDTYTFKGVTVKNSDEPYSVMRNGIQMRGIYKTTAKNEEPIYGDRSHLYYVNNSKFYDWSQLESLSAFSAYIYTEAEYNAAKPLIFMIDGEATGITNVNATENDAAEYNALGMRVSKTAKGLHVKNGKKYFVK